jgi:hypothetical protein
MLASPREAAMGAAWSNRVPYVANWQHHARKYASRRLWGKIVLPLADF